MTWSETLVDVLYPTHSTSPRLTSCVMQNNKQLLKALHLTDVSYVTVRMGVKEGGMTRAF